MGVRRWIIMFVYDICVRLYLVVFGMRTELNHIDFDYSFFLGPDYKDLMPKIKQTSTIVCNHVSWLDSVILIKHIRPAFSPTIGVK
jgi:1-acyl-sn-glycerol-3-phosphate acyltransferase